jgi:hypothetical protein
MQYYLPTCMDQRPQKWTIDIKFLKVKLILLIFNKSIHVAAHYLFMLDVDQISCMIVANNNTYIVNQKMELYFVSFFFHPKSMLFVIMVTCDSSNVIS